MFWAAIVICLQRILNGHSRRAIICLVGLLAALDPLIAVYTRFWLSDLAAMSFFLVFVALLQRPFLSNQPPRLSDWLLLSAASLACIFTRIAYAPAELLTICTLFILKRGKLLGSPRLSFLALAIIPILSIATLAACNSIVFSSKFGGKPFVNKMSALLQLGVNLPATRIDDFRAAGIDLTHAEFDRLQVWDYDRRDSHVWGDDPHEHVRILIQSKLKISDYYSDDLQARFRRITVHAFKTRPWRFVVVYGVNLAFYFEPHRWKGPFWQNMGFTRPLPEWAVQYLTSRTATTFSPDDTKRPSIIIDILERVISVYPFLLGFGCVLAFAIILKSERNMNLVVPACALLAVMACAPLYSTSVQPRYVLAAVLLTYIILPAIKVALPRQVLALKETSPGTQHSVKMTSGPPLASAISS